MKRSRHRLALLVAGVLTAAPLGAQAPSASVVVAVDNGIERREVELGGRLVAALAVPGGEDGLLLLVRPESEVDGPRRLLALRDGSPPPVREIRDALGGWTKTLAAVDLGDGAELVVGGLGRLVSLGPLAAPGSEARSLVEHPGFDLRSLAPGELRVGVERRLAAAEVGALRVWQPTGAGALTRIAELALPFSAERNRGGLGLRGVPVRELPPTSDGRWRFAAGPEVVGARLRVVLLSEGTEGEWTRAEAWSSLPSAESVEESWYGSLDGVPALVARTQGAAEMNAFEDQRWRVFRLMPDITRAGRGPALAVTVDSKRWHDNDARLVDTDGDGHDDLVFARPEGLTGGDLVVEVFPGIGNGRFDPRSRRTDIDDAPSSFSLLPDVDGSGRAGIVGLYDDHVVLWRLASRGRRALEKTPVLSAGWSEPDAAPAAEGGSRWTSYRWLGAVPRPGGPPDLLVVADPEKGGSRLIAVRAAAP